MTLSNVKVTKLPLVHLYLKKKHSRSAT